MKIKNILLTVAMLLAFPFSDAFAKGFSSSRSGGSSSSRSFSSGRSSTPSASKPSFSSGRSSTPSATPSKPSGFSSGSTTPSTPSKSWFGGSTKTATPKTSFDHAQQRAKMMPPPMKPKETYVNEFKAQNAAKYPNTFATPPAQRPSYIPPTTVHNNTNVPIQYNPATQSYGFFDGLGKFMVYDAITNMAMKSFDSDSQKHTQAVAAANSYTPPNDTKDDSGSGWGSFFFWFFAILIVIGIIFVFNS